jgi:hypothetical protein
MADLLNRNSIAETSTLENSNMTIFSSESDPHWFQECESSEFSFPNDLDLLIGSDSGWGFQILPK